MEQRAYPLDQASIDSIKEDIARIVGGMNLEEYLDNENLDDSIVRERLVDDDFLDDILPPENFSQSANGDSGRKKVKIVTELTSKVFQELQMRQTGRKAENSSVPESVANGISRGALFLELSLHEGRAFTDYLPGDAEAELSLHLAFGGQRYHTRKFDCVSNPKISETFYIELLPAAIGESSLLALNEPLHAVLVRHDRSDTQLVSSTLIDWRPLLWEQSLSFRRTVKLNSIGSDMQAPAGLLDISVRLMQSAHRRVDILTQELVLEQNAREQRSRDDAERVFQLYARNWWAEFCSVRESNEDRMVKILAKDERGCERFVCEFVRPLRAGRLIPSARHAARFVSTIPFERANSLGYAQADMWCSLHAFVTRNRGDHGDHACLLCSLLIGFSLDAYVAVGSRADGKSVVWVVTICDFDLGQPCVYFWDPVSGQRHLHCDQSEFPSIKRQQQQQKHPYARIGCLFNHRSFFANNQASDEVNLCKFDLDNRAQWKPMSEEAIKSLLAAVRPGSSRLWTLAAPLVDSQRASDQFEAALREAVTERRRQNGQQTQFDAELSFCLTEALAGYEMERLYGLSFGNEEFQSAIRNLVPAGYSFKAYPLQVLHRDARRALASALKSPVAQQICDCRGEQVRLAVRATVITYAESAHATWLMLACTFRSEAL